MRDGAELSNLLLGNSIDAESPRTRLTDKDALALAKKFDEEMYPRAFGEFALRGLGGPIVVVGNGPGGLGCSPGLRLDLNLVFLCRLGQGERDRRERRYDHMVRIPQDVPLPERGPIGRARRHVEG